MLIHKDLCGDEIVMMIGRVTISLDRIDKFSQTLKLSIDRIVGIWPSKNLERQQILSV